ncbi:hypothetical protein B296_00001356 [Ensete ventricosum]|uniref:Uncharacterized protein n=1 Tax=Ensete ventricosum TaxID=4639 RepID=A0A426Z3J3_ENSVE|nr:hypothetical protein B296_00001356 [Ensete ventricosum]
MGATHEERYSEQDEREVGYSPRGEEVSSGELTGKKSHKERIITAEPRLDVLEASMEELYQGQQRLLGVKSSLEEAESRIEKVESLIDQLTEDTKDSVRHLHEVVAKLTAKMNDYQHHGSPYRSIPVYRPIVVMVRAELYQAIPTDKRTKPDQAIRPIRFVSLLVNQNQRDSLRFGSFLGSQKMNQMTNSGPNQWDPFAMAASGSSAPLPASSAPPYSGAARIADSPCFPQYTASLKCESP